LNGGRWFDGAVGTVDAVVAMGAVGGIMRGWNGGRLDDWILAIVD